MGAIISFLGAHFDKIGLVYQIAETGSVVWQNSSAKRFEDGKKTRTLFEIASASIGCVAALVLFEGKLSLLSRVARIVPGLIIYSLPVAASAILGGGLLAVGAIITFGIAHKLFQPKSNLCDHLPPLLSEEKKKIKMTWKQPGSIPFAQVLLSARMVTNLALAYFAANPYLFLATAALEMGSVVLMARWKWICYEATIEPKASSPQGGEPQALFDDGPRQIILSMYRLVFPVEIFPPSEQEVLRDLHNTHTELTKSGILGDKFLLRDKPTYENRHFKRGPVTSIAYQVQIDNEILTGTSNVEVVIVDSRFPKLGVPATVEIVSKREIVRQRLSGDQSGDFGWRTRTPQSIRA